MKFLNKILLLLLLSLCSVANTQTPSVDPHWLIYRDWNFKTMTMEELILDWDIDPCQKTLDHSSGDVEPQLYRPENVSISPSGLKLTVKEEHIFGKIICYYPPDSIFSDGISNDRWFEYSSGWVETLENMKYGYIESRMKVPYGYDFFPAFWIFKHDDPESPNGSEIDIFEMLPSKTGTPEEPIVPFPLNYNIQKTNVVLDGGYNEDIQIDDYREYHTYGLEWSPSKIIWYFDDQIIRVLSNPGANAYTKTILNLALTPFKELQSENTTYPSSMEIDFVKWYKLKNDCNTIVNECLFPFASYTSTVKNSITIGGDGCINDQPLGSSLTLRATDFVEIKGDFNLFLGSELYIDVNECTD